MIDWSSIPKQTFLVENGQKGDCWRCCIAAILGLPATEVPHFLEEAIREKTSMDPNTQRWLNKRGYCLVEATKFQFPRWYGEPFAGLPVIASGPTPRSTGMDQHHAVVMVGGKMVYDPHPSNAGLTAITEEYLVVHML